MQKSLLVLSALLITLASASFNLSDYLCPECTCVGSDKAFNRGDIAYVCVHFLQVVNGTLNAQRAAFPVTVDKFSALGITGAYNKYVTNAKSSNVSTFLLIQAHGGQKSHPIQYVLPAPSQFYANLYSIVINITDGRVGGVTWDNTCYCDAFYCNSISFASLNDSSTEDFLCNSVIDCFTPTGVTATDSVCDPKIYVSWLGTDSRDQRMQSAGLRLSRFRSYSVADIWAKAQTLVPAASSSTARMLFGEDNKCFLMEKDIPADEE